MRKTQQFSCYAAEDELGDGGVRFASVAAAQVWVDDLRDTPWWHLQGFSLAVLRIEVGAAPVRKGESVGWYDAAKSAGRIELHSSHLNGLIALHEVAHVLAEAMYQSKSHDPAWAMVFLTLVSQALGADQYLQLKRGFDHHDVSYDVTPKSSGVFAL